MLEEFTDEGRRVLDLAKDEAQVLHHNVVGTEDLLLGLLRDHNGAAGDVLDENGVTLERAREEVSKYLGRSSPEDESTGFTTRGNRVLEFSAQQAQQLGQDLVGPDHILLGVIAEEEGVAAQVLTGLGADVRGLRRQLLARMNLMTEATAYLPEGPVVRAISHTTSLMPNLRHHSIPVGTEWTATAVRAGRGPADFAKAYEALERLAAKVGIDVDDYRVRVESVQTDRGPGLRLALSHRLEEQDVESDDEAD